MARDQRWPFIPFLIVRAIQMLFGVIILGMTAYLCSLGDIWWAAMGVFISLVILLWMVANFALYFMGLLLPLAVVIVDAFVSLFLLISMAGTADSGVLSVDCDLVNYYSDLLGYDSDADAACMAVKGAFAMELLGMFLFIASLVFASITLHKTRKDLRGKKYNQGLPFVSGSSAEAGAGVAQQQIEQPYYPAQQMSTPAPYDPNQPQYYPQQQQQPQPQQTGGYVQGPTYDGFISPPTSPPPGQQMQPHHTGGYSTVSSVPAAAAEMPGDHTVPPKGSELPN